GRGLGITGADVLHQVGEVRWAKALTVGPGGSCGEVHWPRRGAGGPFRGPEEVESRERERRVDLHRALEVSGGFLVQPASVLGPAPQIGLQRGEGRRGKGNQVA